VVRSLQVASLYWVVWTCLTPVILAAVRRWPFDERPLAARIVLHETLAAALSFVQTAITLGTRSLILWLSGVADRHQAFAQLTSRSALVWGVFTGMLFYSVVAMVYTALRYRSLYTSERLSAAELATRSAALEAELTRSKLDALRTQLRPHFLFNTLNTISVLMTADAAKARRMLLQLSSLLRRSLDEEAHEVTLRQELEFLNDYLEIQRVRAGDRLNVQIEVDPSVLAERVPAFLLQPLVENAIVHGRSRDGSNAIRLSARRDGDMLRVCLEDDGPGVSADEPNHEGVGLRNTRDRLRHLYGSRATVELRDQREATRSHGGRVEIRIPLAALSA
jgi:LytS/YehU family sensor histidine kinase